MRLRKSTYAHIERFVCLPSQSPPFPQTHTCSLPLTKASALSTVQRNGSRNTETKQLHALEGLSIVLIDLLYLRKSCCVAKEA